MYIKCPLHHVLLKVTDELIQEAKTKHLLGIPRFTITAEPVGGNHPYIVMLNTPPVKIHVMYLLNNKWSIRTSS
ncbi:hypothetical protein MIF8_39 [Erwinia phage MIF8]